MKTGTQMVAEIKAAGYYMSPNAGGVNYRVLFIGADPMVYAGYDVFSGLDKLRRVA